MVDVDSPKRTHSQSHHIGGIAVFDVTQFTLSSIIGYNGDPKMDYVGDHQTGAAKKRMQQKKGWGDHS